MKKLSVKATKGLFLASGVVTAGVCTLAMSINNNSFESSDKETLSFVENKTIEVEKAKVLVEAEKNIDEAKAKAETANEEVAKATETKEEAAREVKTLEEAVKKAEEAKKVAEAEVNAAKSEEERKVAEAKVKAMEEEIKKAEEERELANAKVKEAEKRVKEAEETRKTAEEVVKQAEEAKKTTETEIEKKATNVNKNTNNETKKSTETKAEEESSRSLTEEQLKYMLEQAKKGEKIDQENYEKALEEKGLKVPEEKHTVEFHFFNTKNPITVHRYGDEDYWSKCGKDGAGCIWFVEFSCDMNECVGFSDSGSDTLKEKVLIGRRGDVLEYTMEAPKGKPGYRFKQWEIISANKTVTNNEYEGVLVSRYRAIYEKY